MPVLVAMQVRGTMSVRRLDTIIAEDVQVRKLQRCMSVVLVLRVYVAAPLQDGAHTWGDAGQCMSDVGVESAGGNEGWCTHTGAVLGSV